MTMTTQEPNKRHFVGETTATYGPFTATGPIGISVAGTFGASGKCAIHPFVGDDYKEIPTLVLTEASAKKIDLAGGDKFKVVFTSCTDVDATLTLYGVAEQ